MDKLTYAQSGVNIDEGNRAVELMKEKVKSTYTDGVVGDIGAFSGGFSLKAFMNMEEPVLLSATDGVGTKLLVAQMMDSHATVGQDLVAMCVNDLICQGARPLFFLDYIATGKVSAEKVAGIVAGIADGCKMANCALIGGETAEMPDLYKEDEYDLAGFAVGIADKKKLIDGSKVSEKDVIVGLSSSGIHSNGYSLARKLFFDKLNLNLDDQFGEAGKKIGDMLLTPTKIYVNTVMEILEKFEVKGIAHITGGGLLENVPRVLNDDLDAHIYKDSWDMPDIFQGIIDLNMIEEEELYRSFNMGIGMVLIASESDAQGIFDLVNSKKIDQAHIIGTIEKGSKKVVLK
ncbi:phosphoribosylformylglycinamidine cyclo-ligase [Acetoanaerobium pronyense]|uniref:Phosphoribosylformylglycinamidine cyclo-ligase n=1 Tax=Acetoanaerobium pronyense TaxID=1482736 RepID=A0ABS4KH56_9FIRM|nr:phosphoribosylformylglycinamidine cyclo-ligase [Acetoanaerobium pronyense]MBP2027108.1 phosphoribosylformylglycinamidine cyclo-ligase [Acetoanaerobium pronyense]